MIIRQRTNWFRMLFIWKGSVLRKIIPQLAMITLFSLVILYFKGNIYEYKVHLNPAIFTLLGLSLAIFMGFCNSASYDRFWEGRKLWGSLVIETRSLTREVLTLINDDEPNAKDKKQEFVRMISAFCWALNYQLRNKNANEKLKNLLSAENFERVKDKKFKPVILLDLMGAWLNRQNQDKKMDTIVLASIDNQLNMMSQIIGGCERIANTPLPFAYTVLLHRTVYLYCFWLPFGLVDVVGWMMPVIVLFISYTFIALDAIIQEIQEPFGEEENDLALNSICTTIQFSIFEQADIKQPTLDVPTQYFID
ncbi:putative membrane protein [Epilithonimonas bovis DSM 19482]|uniref:Putative membrane protein n=1 Tax=Epilithonimonas bovis DSM 19482 TaxID=1121284 RepID=A0A1U7PXI2_9FLAO|nr:bestrophin family ion channel [Epilithonimonas bovis]SIT96478.1 putative membrane protein [Epilithonimonas bovis DSM 19482]